MSYLWDKLYKMIGVFTSHKESLQGTEVVDIKKTGNKNNEFLELVIIIVVSVIASLVTNLLLMM